MNTKITIGKVDIGWWKKVTLHNVLIFDQQNDTLFHVGKLKAKYQLFSSEQKTIYLDNIELDNANIHFEQKEESEKFNFNFFISYFKPKKKRDPNKPKSIWTISSKRVVLTNSTFRYWNHKLPAPKGRRFNENFFEFSAINGKVDSFSIINDSLSFLIRNLSTLEKSGLQVKT